MDRKDESKLTETRPVDDIDVILSWLRKATLCLAEDQPTHGNIETVNLLMEQHRVRTNTS